MHLWRYELLKLPHELDEEDQQMHWWLLVFLINKICTSLVDLTANTNRQATFVMSSRWGILSGAKQNSIAQRDLINRQGSKLKMKSQKHSHGSIWRKYNLRVAGDTDEPQEKQAVMEAKFSRHVLSKMLWRRNKPANSKTVKQEGKRQKKKKRQWSYRGETEHRIICEKTPADCIQRLRCKKKKLRPGKLTCTWQIFLQRNVWHL